MRGVYLDGVYGTLCADGWRPFTVRLCSRTTWVGWLGFVGGFAELLRINFPPTPEISMPPVPYVDND